MGEQILIVDDEKEMRKLLSICLRPSHYQIDEASNGEEALEKIKQFDYQLVILDIMMPVKDGFELLKTLRLNLEKHIPVILLTALGDSDRVVEGLKLGADDYIVKPFEPKELLARVEAVLRRSRNKWNTAEKEGFTVMDLHFQPDSYRVIYENKVLPLTKKEFQIFYRLANNPGRVFSREDLLELEWGLAYEGDNRTVDTHVKNIREKLKSMNYNKPVIETVWGIGYKIPDSDT
ncbi:response regulator transcription factor [Evansella clarkii]|uniref:response regulator transcription factor n=1 Tax=Evansella clarkii TaxID=79879 RepID=UPI000996B08E|nr:response regulator transcription factor [Evansella clarkii]